LETLSFTNHVSDALEKKVQTGAAIEIIVQKLTEGKNPVDEFEKIKNDLFLFIAHYLPLERELAMIRREV